MVLGLSGVFGIGVAHAERPPAVNPGLLPAGDPAAPQEKTEQPPSTPCAVVYPGGDGSTIPQAQRALNLEAAWQLSRGAGQVVAVIDTGVARHPRLPGLEAAGDFVAAGGDGTDDCDAHGTFVAGLIAASQAPGQGFAGVAPDARIISIRQSSGAWQKQGAANNKAPGDFADGYGNLTTMAAAIRRAVDKGATIINLSEAWCGSDNYVDSSVGAAVQYAFERDVVVVSAAGNNDTQSCQGNASVLDPLTPNADPWSKISLNVSPARWDQYVLSVGSVDDNGAPSKFTVPGPWLSVAAPGENMVSLDPRTAGTANGKFFKNVNGQISGTSFAAPLVSGVAALIKARYPGISAKEVMKRIQATAHAPAGGWNQYVGYGTVDPLAALTAEVNTPLPPKRPAAAKSVQLPLPTPISPPDNTPRNVALIGTGIIAAALILGFLASFPIRRRFGIRSGE
ncbi:type VII secretion-associated serine protease mycosin [Nocardia panacis]|uniref:Type VII secretion-associated serine protease mycosin n=1 Tax=Nocardia panacis TaxID=2340916 RepID=A0A3A4KE69_9NOCA|nr:type VII secretion-associated serine protease mycosin [Nocardia panacis]